MSTQEPLQPLIFDIKFSVFLTCEFEIIPINGDNTFESHLDNLLLTEPITKADKSNVIVFLDDTYCFKWRLYC